jgi:pimeloyl-ACP methyl ester carboxylesterase
MIVFVLLGLVLALGAVITALGSRRIAAAHPPRGRFVATGSGNVHVVELGASHSDEPAILLIHGASGNLEDMRPLGEVLAARWRVLLIDRPGHGWSDRPAQANAAWPGNQAQVIAGALDALGVSQSVVVGHSLGGTVAAAFALAQPERTRGLVLLSAVTHPWTGGVAWYYTIASTRWLGTLFARTLALPLGQTLLPSGIRAVFAPNPAPADYARRSGVAMFLRPREFIANAADVAALFPFVVRHSRRYGELRMPVAILSGDADSVVSVDIHARALARDVEGSRLVILPGGGHMPHHSATRLAADLIDEVAAKAGFQSAAGSQTGEQRQPCGPERVSASPF